jgi:AcrR family transcriptional regulator
MDISRPEPPPPLSERSAEIIGLVREAFVEKGFDGASMQDLARAAGMSVGNFYRYFPSKAAIVEAMVAYDMAEIERKFADIACADDLVGMVRAKLAEQVRNGRKRNGGLWAEINAAAHRKTEIAGICCGMEDMVADNMIAVFARLTGTSVESARQRFGTHARFIVLLVKAAATRTDPSPDPDLDALILQSVYRVLDDIIAAAEKS